MFTFTININDSSDTGVKYKYIDENALLNNDDYKEIVQIIEDFYKTTFYIYFSELMKQ